jgi:hypothetical protein
MVCRGSVGSLINGEFDEHRRCWDVVTADPYENLGNECSIQTCLGDAICLYNDCEDPACVDGDGIPGICRAMGMQCDANPYGFGDPYCINTNGCDIPGTFNGTSTCSTENTKTLLNRPFGISGEQMCPQPYGF